MKIIKFVGFSGSGKTTLIEKIVSKLSSDGVKVATIKHDVHGLDIDKEGKDSFRYSKAGANLSVVSSNDMTVFKIHRKLSLDDIISNVKNVDLIIVEGYSVEDDIPTVGVARKETRKGFKNDINKYVFLSTDYNKNELKSMGYKGFFVDINDINNNIKSVLEFSKIV